jgi:hypothetical protein
MRRFQRIHQPVERITLLRDCRARTEQLEDDIALRGLRNRSAKRLTGVRLALRADTNAAGIGSFELHHRHRHAVDLQLLHLRNDRSARRRAELRLPPTIGELGYPRLELFSWGSFVAPAGTPPEVVARLNAQILKVAKQPEMAEWMKKTGSEFIPFTPKGFGEFLQSEVMKWQKISEETGIRAAP